MLSFFINLFSDKAAESRNTGNVNVFPRRCLRLQEEGSLCHNCVKSCPEEAVDLRGKIRLIPDKCNGCGICTEVCPSGVFSFPQAQDDTQISRRDFFTRLKDH